MTWKERAIKQFILKQKCCVAIVWSGVLLSEKRSEDPLAWAMMQRVLKGEEERVRWWRSEFLRERQGMLKRTR